MSHTMLIIPQDIITKKIYLIRNKQVMLDSDLAILYGVETKKLNQAVKRNLNRFPKDFMFQLTNKEFTNLRSQIVTSSWGGQRYTPYAFTEHGILMLSSILNSKQAVAVNIQIMRTFIAIRESLATHKELKHKIKEIEKNIASKFDSYDEQFQLVFNAFEEIKFLLGVHQSKKHRKIGFHPQ